MPAKYSRCPVSVYEQAATLIETHHKDLNSVGIHFDFIFAYGGENEQGEKLGPALKLHGYPCSGIAKIVGLKDRVMGRMDGEVLLDGDRWGSLTPEQQNALLDHELYHFQIARNVEGETILDTAGRPKLKLRLHDREFGWFDEIAKRHGQASGEVTQAALLFQEAGQIYFSFAKTITQRKQKTKALKDA